MSLDLVDIGRRDLQDITGLEQKLKEVMSKEEVREAVEKAFRDWTRHFEEKYQAVGAVSLRLSVHKPGSCEFDAPLRGVNDDSRGPESQAAPFRFAGHAFRVRPVACAAEEAFEEGPLELISRKPRAYLQLLGASRVLLYSSGRGS